MSSAKVAAMPESHKWPEAYCPRVAHNEYVAGLELPVVDLLEEQEVALPKLAAACKEWGFFHVVNHDVPAELMSAMEEICKAFFELSVEQKVQVTGEGTRRHRLYDFITRKVYKACSWVEGLNIHDYETIPSIAKEAWPEQQEEICSIFSKYLEEMQNLSSRLFRMMILGLGLDESKAKDMLDGCGFTGTRFNYYPTCPDPSRALGVVPHADPNCVTVLYQDQVGGLQVCKDGEWIGVKPLPNSFVINIGDSFQAWTNFVYKSVEHRAVVNQKSARLSIAYFYAPVHDFEIRPPSDLVDDKHPYRCRPFCYKDYLTFRMKTDLFGRSAFEVFAADQKSCK